MAEPTEAMHQHIAALRALRAKTGGGAAGSGPAPAGMPAQRGPRSQAPARAATPVGLPWSPPARPGAADVPVTSALSGLRVEPAPGPAPSSAGSAAGPAAVNLGPVASLDSGASGTDALLAAGDREAGAAQARQALDRRARVAQAAVPDPGTVAPVPGTLGHIGAGLYHGANKPFVAIDRASTAATQWIERQVPGFAQLNGMIGDTPEGRTAHLAQLDADEADYHQQHDGSRAARVADVTGQAVTAGAATVATGGFAALPEMMAGRAALAQTARAVPGVFGQSAQTFMVNAGVGCVSGGISGGLSDGWKGGAIGCGAGAVTNVAAPAAAGWAMQSVRSSGGGALAQGLTFGATYTGLNAFGGGATQYSANAAFDRPAWENVPRAAALGGLMPLASGDTALSSLTAATTRAGTRLELQELGSNALTAHTGLFGIGSTVGANAYDARQQAIAETDKQSTGLYIGTHAALTLEGDGS